MQALARRRQIEGTMDVASYVKYNARLVEATRAHAAAMRHVHALWSLVLRSDEEFLQRSARLSESIDKEVGPFSLDRMLPIEPICDRGFCLGCCCFDLLPAYL